MMFHQSVQMLKPPGRQLVQHVALEGNAGGENAIEGGDAIGGDLSFTPPVGMLADVAPTVCKLLGIAAAGDMTGQSLV
jgi:hypothetical protein